MVQRSFSPCFFGNKVTMAFKLIFVFAIIAIFAVDALDIKNCHGNYPIKAGKNFRRNGRNIVGHVYHKGKICTSLIPKKYEIETKKGVVARGNIAGWNGLKRWVQTGVNCNKNGWRFVKFKSGVLATDPKTEYTLRIRNGRNKVLGCFKIDD